VLINRIQLSTNMTLDHFSHLRFDGQGIYHWCRE